MIPSDNAELYPGDAVDPTDEDLLTNDKVHGNEVNNLEHARRVAFAVNQIIHILTCLGANTTDQEKKTALKIVLRNI